MARRKLRTGTSRMKSEQAEHAIAEHLRLFAGNRYCLPGQTGIWVAVESHRSGAVVAKIPDSMWWKGDSQATVAWHEQYFVRDRAFELILKGLVRRLEATE